MPTLAGHGTGPRRLGFPSPAPGVVSDVRPSFHNRRNCTRSPEPRAKRVSDVNGRFTIVHLPRYCGRKGALTGGYETIAGGGRPVGPGGCRSVDQTGRRRPGGPDGGRHGARLPIDRNRQPATDYETLRPGFGADRPMAHSPRIVARRLRWGDFGRLTRFSASIRFLHNCFEPGFPRLLSGDSGRL